MFKVSLLPGFEPGSPACKTGMLTTTPQQFTLHNSILGYSCVYLAIHGNTYCLPESPVYHPYINSHSSYDYYRILTITLSCPQMLAIRGAPTLSPSWIESRPREQLAVHSEFNLCSSSFIVYKQTDSLQLIICIVSGLSTLASDSHAGWEPVWSSWQRCHCQRVWESLGSWSSLNSHSTWNH